MIKTIHRIWMGPEMPKDYKEFGLKWQRMNPNWTVIDWTDKSIKRLGVINNDVYQRIVTPNEGKKVHRVAAVTQQADVVSYELLYRFGGLYLNADIEPVRPLNVLFKNNPHMNEMPAAAEEDLYYIVNAAMWAPTSRMDFWGAVIDELPHRYFANPDGYMNETTGPHLLTDVWRRDINRLYTIPVETFNPYSLHDIPLGGSAEWNIDILPPTTVAVHHWGHRRNQRPQSSTIGLHEAYPE